MQHFLIEAVVMILVISIVPIGIVGLVSGLVVALQSATQIQEQSIVHLVRLGVFAVVLYFLGHAAYSQVENFFVRALLAVENVGQLGK